MKKELTPTQELELLSALESRAEVPFKFAYIGEGAKNWIKYVEESRKKHELEYKEDGLKTESLPFIFREIDNQTDTVNIIDFGCGDGVPMLPICEYLKNISNISIIRYIPVDISESMIAEAMATISAKFPEIEIIPIVFDFEKGEILEKIIQLAKAGRARNYFFLLGNTLGNFDNTKKILSNLKLSMFSEDKLIVGNQVSNFLAYVKLVEYYKTKEVFDLLVGVLKRYGMVCDFNEYNVRWNNEKKQIECFLIVERDKQIMISDHIVRFEKGEEILLAISRKFMEESIVEIFNSVGFRIDFFSTNKQKDTLIASVSPSRYKS
ncbi:MAG: L-histidine N(alpha)-methyltransferase [Candidatus Paceibacterota bacterium]